MHKVELLALSFCVIQITSIDTVVTLVFCLLPPAAVALNSSTQPLYGSDNSTLIMLLIVSIFSLCNLASAGRYFIDPKTCDRAEFIDQNVDMAFNIAQSALDALNAQPVDSETLQNSRHMLEEGQIPVGWSRALLGGGNFPAVDEQRGLIQPSIAGLLSYNNRGVAGTSFNKLTADDVVSLSHRHLCSQL